MCGIAGIYAYRDSAQSVDLDELRVIRDHMARRGPDGSGEWLSEDRRVGFGHRRLAIIDLSDRAAQPMHTSDGRLTITFNGEIYNYVALRQELERKGYVFRTTSDTEVLLHLYRDRGVDMLHALRGMYAFGLWDAVDKSLLLARDPYGIKPLYYADQDGTLRFASQVRALLAGGGVSREPDSAGQVGFYLWGSVPEPYTTYRSISALPAGSYLVAKSAAVGAPHTHFSIARCWADACESAEPIPTADEAQTLVREALRASVASHMVADVPVSAFLSGGIDSGSLVGLMAEQGVASTHAITLSFAEFSGSNDDEVPLAAAVARYYGVQHHIRHVGQTEFREDLPAILAAMDQPTIDGVNTWFVSKATCELGLKVAISGLGGDELFGGYSTFQTVPRFVRTMFWPSQVPGLGEALRRAAGPVLTRVPGAHPKLAGLAEYGGSYPGAYMLKRGLFMPWELDSILPSDLVREGLDQLEPSRRLQSLLSPMPRTDWAKVAVLEASQYMRNQLLRDTDWASMAHSLEVRVPLVDHMLLTQLAAPIARARRIEGKRWLAMSPARPLPLHVRNRAKTGFSTPIESWLSHAKELDAWRRLPSLAHPTCPWARRFAYTVGQMLA
jgi:asparagine synthase (glutamine-hydrolysing)